MQFINIFTGQPILPLPWQLELKPGDFYEIKDPAFGLLAAGMTSLEGVTLFGEILNAKGCDEGFFNVRAFSKYCPDGEEGLLCIVEPTRVITKDEFEAARLRGWI